MKAKNAEFASGIFVQVSARGMKNSGIPIISEGLLHSELFTLSCCKSFLSRIFKLWWLFSASEYLKTSIHQ